MRCPRGQATVDYVALVALVAVLLALALGAASAGAAGVVNAVAGQIRHALCAVGGGPCPDLRSRPCAVAGVALGVQVGGEYEHTVETSRLLAARSRPAGGLWERRLDCVPA